MSSLKNPKSDSPARALRLARWRALLGPLRTFAWVAGISVLVWVWADLERTETLQMRVPLRLVPPPGSDVRVILPDPRQGRIAYFTATGSQMAMHDLQAALRAGALAYEFPIDPDWLDGEEHFVNTAELLNEWDRLQSAGITVLSAEPEQIRVELGRWKTVEATVRPVVTGAATEGSPAAQPAQVRVRVPEEAVLLGTPTIETVLIDLAGEPPGPEPARRSAALRDTIGGYPAEPVDAAQVEVTYRIAQPVATQRVPVTASVKLPASWLEDDETSYVLDRPDPTQWTRELLISGPPVDLQRLQARATRVEAFVELTENDRSGGLSIDHRVTLILPENLQLAEPLDWRVDIDLRPRSPR